MNTNGCTAATCAASAPDARASADQSLHALLVALAGTLFLAAIGTRMVSLTPMDQSFAAPETAGQEAVARRDLLAELGRSAPEPFRVVSLLEASRMSAGEGIGALELARRAAAGGGSWQKARDLGAVIARLRAGESGR